MSENKQKRAGQMETIRKVLHYIKKYWLLVGLSLVLAAVIVALTLYVPILTGDAVDLIVDKGLVDMPGIFVILKKIAIAMILTAVAQWVMNTANNYITYHVIQDIRQDAFHKLENLATSTARSTATAVFLYEPGMRKTGYSENAYN